jgi:hypothetical protein
VMTPGPSTCQNRRRAGHGPFSMVAVLLVRRFPFRLLPGRRGLTPTIPQYSMSIEVRIS